MSERVWVKDLEEKKSKRDSSKGEVGRGGIQSKKHLQANTIP